LRPPLLSRSAPREDRLARGRRSTRAGNGIIARRTGGDMTRFRSPDEVQARLAAAGDLADEPVAVSVYLADRRGTPLLCEGPAGVGKTALGKGIAAASGHRLMRLQCYEGLDEAKTLYEWNYKKQLLRIQADPGEREWRRVEDDIFTEDFLLAR